MNNKFSIKAFVLALAAIVGLTANAANVDQTAARSIASSLLKIRAAQPGSIKAPALADLKLIHAEKSTVGNTANAYYAFNIKGGGFIIIAGDDRASQVLGFSDQGSLDFNNMPDGLEWLLSDYKRQIEFLQANPMLNVTPRRARFTDGNPTIIVEPLVTAHWGQHRPYYLQCPMLDGAYSKVGCAGIQMAQVLYYWQYPKTCGPLDGYYSSSLSDSVPPLPATTFDYDKMLDRYCHWDPELGEPVQEVYTDEQAQAVAKLCRYAGQAARMNYSPTGSSTDGYRKLVGMKTLGFNRNAKSISFKSPYTTETWEELMRAELDGGRPIMYGAKGVGISVGHAFIMDGYDSDNYFHINFGWYGVSDGWFLTTAIITTNLDGKYRNYGDDHYMFINLFPTEYCKVVAQGVEAGNGLLVLGDDIHPCATGVNLFTNYTDVDLLFSLTDQEGNLVATGDTINVVASEFVQRSDINGALMLPTTLTNGTYNLQFNCFADDALTTVCTAQGKLTVVGHLAKFNAAFSIGDVTATIDYLLDGTYPWLSIADVTTLIDYMLMSN